MLFVYHTMSYSIYMYDDVTEEIMSISITSSVYSQKSDMSGVGGGGGYSEQYWWLTTNKGFEAQSHQILTT